MSKTCKRSSMLTAVCLVVESERSNASVDSHAKHNVVAICRANIIASPRKVKDRFPGEITFKQSLYRLRRLCPRGFNVDKCS